jgi:PAS domain S-box-containing protein
MAVGLLAASAWLVQANLREVARNIAFDDNVRRAELAEVRLLSVLESAETGQRGYLLTDNPAYLAPYEAARRQLNARLEWLQVAPLVGASQAWDVAQLRRLADEKMAELARTIELQRTGQRQAALVLVKTNQGQRLMEAIRAQVGALQAAAARQLAAQRHQNHLETRWIMVAGLAGLAVLLLAGGFLTRRLTRRSVAASEAALTTFIDAFDLAHGMLQSTDGRITFWSSGAARLYGFSPEEAVGRLSHELLRTQFPCARAEIEAELQSRGTWQGELVHYRSDGTAVTVASHWAIHRGAQRSADAIIQVDNDTSDMRSAQRERQRADMLLRTIVETAPVLIYARHSDNNLALANQLATDLLGDPGSAELVMENDRRVMKSNAAAILEERIGCMDGNGRVWLSAKTPLHEVGGNVIGMVNVSVEITDRKRDETRLRLLVHELNHRVKNTLATVQAITAQSLQHGNLVQRRALEERLLALACAHDVLTEACWEGAELHELVARVLAAFGGQDSSRFQTSGPRVRLHPRAALALAMALHELATNALKYGALSASTSSAGKVMLDWEIEGGRLHLVWSEQGGPKVVTPTRRGFGARLIQRSLIQDLGARAVLEFAPHGVVCTIDAALKDIAAGAADLPSVGF